MIYSLNDVNSRKNIDIRLVENLTFPKYYLTKDQTTENLKKDFLFNSLNLLTFNQDNIDEKFKILKNLSKKENFENFDKIKENYKKNGISQYFRYSHLYKKNINNKTIYIFEGILTRTIEKDGKIFYIYDKIPYIIKYEIGFSNGKIYIEGINTILKDKKKNLNISEFKFNFEQNGEKKNVI